MSSSIPQNANVYTEMSSLKALKGQVNAGDKGAIKEVAQQFEAIFLQMMLSGMRKTIQVDEEYGNDKAMYYDLFDKQVAMNLAEKGGIGLTKIMMSQGGIESQSHQPSLPSIPASAHRWHTQPHRVSEQSNENHQLKKIFDESIQTNTKNDMVNLQETEKSQNQTQAMPSFDSPVEFIQTIWNIAKDVITESGINPKVVIAQAALETGWGKHVMNKASGESSFNLFGIKSGKRWSGDQAIANTLEFKDGLMVNTREGFRAYESIKESVQDYVNFLKDNQRYKGVIEQSENPEQYAIELQNAGYATDPEYANKLMNIMKRQEFTHIFDRYENNGV